MRLRRSASLGITVVATLLTGCVVYFRDIRVEPPLGAPARLTEQEIADAVRAIGVALADLGMVEARDLEKPDPTSDEWPAAPDLVVGAFRARPDAEAFEGHQIGVYCLVGKKSGEFTVRINDLQWPAEFEITRKIQERIREVLQKQFPAASFPEKSWHDLRLLALATDSDFGEQPLRRGPVPA